MSAPKYRKTVCAGCPWRVENHGKPHPDGWYRKTNRRRLWTGIRRSEANGMTCHPTDPNNPVPDGHTGPAEDAQVYECAGALALVQIEVKAYEAAAEDVDGTGYPEYVTAAKARGVQPMTKEGLLEFVMSRQMPPPFGGADHDDPMPDYIALWGDQSPEVHQ